ncbi:MAG: patatin-like phospholipase family protein [Sphingobacteriaceae bacterium]|nr:patatin-like phospholipase family protein [Sphingobacteriaceae bacterium]
MKADAFIGNNEIVQIIQNLKQEGIHQKEFSDVTDGIHQYVDLVMEGGGVLGIALAGYVHVLEEMNIRFLQLGGTSAGAINTMLMAASGPIHEAKTGWILEQICNKNFYDFVDGDKDAKKFIEAVLQDAGKLQMALKGVQVIDNLNNDLGLNPGNEFKSWIKQLLHSKGIVSLKDLQTLRKTGPPTGLYNKINKEVKYGPEAYERIVIVSADVTTESKIIFPEMAELFWSEPENINPAEFVRATMSIPFFFFPYRVKSIPQGTIANEKWKKHTGFEGVIPTEVAFVDGGIMSNFPIDIFHEHRKIPESPTFGVKLGVDRSETKKTDKIFSFIGAMFDSARHVHDYNYLFKNPDFKKLICVINIGHHNWLNFNINDQDKIDLFVRGAKDAAKFLREFNWPQYKELRKGTVIMHNTLNKDSIT